MACMCVCNYMTMLACMESNICIKSRVCCDDIMCVYGFQLMNMINLNVHMQAIITKQKQILLVQPCSTASANDMKVVKLKMHAVQKHSGKRRREHVGG